MKAHTLGRAGLQGSIGRQAVNHREVTGRQAQAGRRKGRQAQAGRYRQADTGRGRQAGCWFPPMNGDGRDSASLHAYFPASTEWHLLPAGLEPATYGS